MAPQIHPGSSKMVPECMPPIGGTHFDDPPGSKMTPRGFIVTPGVPKMTPQGAQSDPRGAKSDPRGAQSDHPGPPRPQKGGLLGALSDSKTSFTSRFPFLSPPCVSDYVPCCPLAPPTHQPINTSTQQSIDTTSL